MSDTPKEVQFIGEETEIMENDPSMVIKWPRSLVHRHTYGKLTPFFKGLQESKLMATRCPNPKCKAKELWLPPRAHCPDCHADMKWEEIPQPVIATIYTFTKVVYAGIGLELTTPYWQIDVEIPGACTIFKGYLKYGEPKVGMKVKAEFRKDKPTNTILNMCWVPHKG
ncbi:MAG: hypothetical protein KAS70_07860 [Planctomycetes bacterium]|nr:hypothetical protein [Planctomycetota bacterium]